MAPQKGYKIIPLLLDAVGPLVWRKGGNIKEIALERIRILLGLAKNTFPKDRDLAKRYVELARRIGMKAGVRLPKEEKLFICKGCGSLLVPGVNSRVRTRSDLGTTVLITCLDCGTKKRYPTVRERLSKKDG
ncbi:MAG: ribonuclease P protein component 4 [Candidatus Bathyarchaeia archaeon]